MKKIVDKEELVEGITAYGSCNYNITSVSKITCPAAIQVWGTFSSDLSFGRDCMVLQNHSKKCKLQRIYWGIKDTKGLFFTKWYEMHKRLYPDDYTSYNSWKGSFIDRLFTNGALIKAYYWNAKLDRLINSAEKYISSKEIKIKEIL